MRGETEYDITGDVVLYSDAIRGQQVDHRPDRRNINLSQELANQTFVRPGLFRQMARMGLVMGAIIAGDFLRKRFVVMVKRRHEYYRQYYRQ